VYYLNTTYSITWLNVKSTLRLRSWPVVHLLSGDDVSEIPNYDKKRLRKTGLIANNTSNFYNLMKQCKADVGFLMVDDMSYLPKVSTTK
jgi:hypothetical protein